MDAFKPNEFLQNTFPMKNAFNPETAAPFLELEWFLRRPSWGTPCRRASYWRRTLFA